MSNVLMYDAVPAGVPFIPNNAKAVMGYIDGNYRSFPLLVQRFAGRAHCVSIGVWIGHTGEFSDIEPGNPINTPELVRADFLHRRSLNIWRPGFYGDKTRMAEVILPGLADFPRAEYRLLLADWDGTADFTFYDGARRVVDDGEQIRSLAHYDVSEINPDTFFPPTRKTIHLPRLPTKVLAKVPKGAVHVPIGGGIGVGVAAVLKASGVHLSAAEAATTGAVLASLADWFKHWQGNR